MQWIPQDTVDVTKVKHLPGKVTVVKWSYPGESKRESALKCSVGNRAVLSCWSSDTDAICSRAPELAALLFFSLALALSMPPFPPSCNWSGNSKPLILPLMCVTCIFYFTGLHNKASALTLRKIQDSATVLEMLRA